MLPMGRSVLDISGYTPSPGTTPTKYPISREPTQYIYPGADAKYLSPKSDLEAQEKFTAVDEMDRVVVMPTTNSSTVTSRAPSERGMKSRPQSVHMSYAKSIVG